MMAIQVTHINRIEASTSTAYRAAIAVSKHSWIRSSGSGLRYRLNTKYFCLAPCILNASISLKPHSNLFSLYCNPDLDDRIFDCLLSSVAALQAKDVLASLLFVDDLNVLHARVVGFHNHESSRCCSLWLRNCVWLLSVGYLPDPCMCWNTWPPDDWCSWPSIRYCCCTHR